MHVSILKLDLYEEKVENHLARNRLFISEEVMRDVTLSFNSEIYVRTAACTCVRA